MKHLFSLVVLTLLVSACDSTPVSPDSFVKKRRVIPEEEYKRRIEHIESLVREGRGQEALDEIQLSMRDLPPQRVRRRLQRIAYEVRREQFYSQHPIHLSLRIDQERCFFGDETNVSLRITNLGEDGLVLPARHRSFFEAVTFQDGESSVLHLRVLTRDYDGLGSNWSSSRIVEIPLEDDLSLAPGGSAVIESQVLLDGGKGSLLRIMHVSAIYRPIAILGGDGQRRYDPLQFPRATLRVFQREHMRWVEGGLPLLEASLSGESSGRSETVFLSAVGLEVADLSSGIDLLARAAPSLDAIRQRRAVSALSTLTGESFANDPVRILGWWEQEGQLLSDTELGIRAGLVVSEGNGILRAGGGAP